MTDQDLLRFDPKAHDFMDEPFAFYRQLRTESPVFFDPRHNIFFITRYHDVNQVMKNSTLFSSAVDRASMRAGGLPAGVQKIREAGWPAVPTMSGNDAPNHDVYKALVAPFFTPRNLGPIEEYVVERVDELLSGLPIKESFDFVERFSVPLPVSVIGRTLGLRQYGDDKLKEWSDAFADEIGMLTSDERAIEIAQLTLACHQAMIDTCNQRRKEPQHDIISQLVASDVPAGIQDNLTAVELADTDAPQRKLEEPELVSLLTQLLVAGNETTTNTLSGGIRRLATNADLFQQLKEEPDLVPRFVEECLRLESPVQGQFRKATEDTKIGGTDIPAGSLLHVRLASANRDEEIYGDDDNIIRLTEDQKAPHKSFGMGMHFCVGAMLSRLELKVAFREICQRFNRIDLAVPESELHYHTHFHLRGLQRLPVMLG